MPSSSTTSSLLHQAQAIAPDLVRIRRQIHANPELSFQERATTQLVVETLAKIGYTPRVIANGTGVIAEIGGGDGRLVAIRADMDALPIEETNSVDYCSQNTGVMHACGHDAHTACGLGAAMLLAQEHAQTPLTGRFRFIFQPAEETINDEGLSGASLVIRDGALKDVSCAIALHVFPSIPAGSAAVKSGPMLAACDTFTIRIKGVGAHGGFPQLGVDTIVIAAHVVQAVQTIVSRRTSALDPVVVTLGGIRSTTHRPNIVAEEVEIVGTARYFNSALHETIKEEITRCCRIAEAMGGGFDLTYSGDNPVLNNDPVVAEISRKAIARIVGEDHLFDAPMEMGAEDFSFISAAVPSCFIVLGSGIPGQEHKLHTSTFDIDEKALPLGAAILAESALELATRIL